MCGELPQLGEEKYPGGESDSDDYRRPHRDQRPPDRGGHQNRGGRPLAEKDTMMEKDTQIEVGDPLTEEDTLVEDPLIDMEAP